MNSPLQHALDEFVSRYMALHQQQNKRLLLPYDPDWPSPCYQQQGTPGEDVEWRPVLQSPVADFSNMEQALEFTMNPQLAQLFGRYWSEPLKASTERGNLELLLPWNPDDLQRLQKNLIGHVLMKRRLKQPDTLFFAVTDEEDFILSVDNQSGQVVLEQVGLLPQEVLADDLSTFISKLRPVLED